MSIEIANIKKSFGRTQVLNDISLDIPSGRDGRPVGAFRIGEIRCCRVIARAGASVQRAYPFPRH